MTKLRQSALNLIKCLPLDVKEAIALVIETAETQGDYYFNGEETVWEDNVSETLNCLASEIRNLK